MAERELNSNANIRFLQAVHDSQYVDVFVNRRMVFGSLTFQKASNYVSLQPGTYSIDILTSDSPTEKILSGNIIIESGKVYTLAAAGNKENNKLLLIQNLPSVPYGEAKMRFLHLADNVPALDFAVKDRDIVFPNVSFTQITEYLGLTPMTVDLELREAGSKKLIHPMPKLQFKSNKTYTLVLIGADSELSLSIIIE